MKKGTNESLSFTIGIILAVTLLTTLGIFFSKGVAYAGQSSAANLEQLAEKINSLRDRADGRFLYYIEPDFVLVGFGKDKDILRLSGQNCVNWKLKQDIKKPTTNECIGSCLCLCDFDKLYNKLEDACSDAKCRPAKASELSGGSSCMDTVIIPGKSIVGFGAERAAKNVYYKRAGSLITIDDSSSG